MKWLYVLTGLQALISIIVKSDIYALVAIALAILTCAEAILARGEK